MMNVGFQVWANLAQVSQTGLCRANKLLPQPKLKSLMLEIKSSEGAETFEWDIFTDLTICRIWVSGDSLESQCHSHFIIIMHNYILVPRNVPGTGKDRNYLQ